MLRAIKEAWKNLYYGPPDEPPLDHIMVEPANSNWHEEELKIAAERHGKPFRSLTLVERVDPPSRRLQELNALQVAEVPEVTAIKRRAKG